MRRQIGSHPRDLHLGKRNGIGGQSAHAARNCGGRQRTEESSSFHESTSPSKFKILYLATKPGCPISPISCGLRELLEFHAPFLKERRTRCTNPCPLQEI